MNRYHLHWTPGRFAALSLILALAGLPAIGRASAFIADTDIVDHVEHEFSFDPAVPFDTVDVSSERGIVTLTGTVNNLLASERAVRIAKTVRGVRAVVNRIEIEPSVDPSPVELSDSVRAALAYDPATRARD
ncbi:MAG: BON domain-containing protein, partial [Thiogranum sp.]